jgi:diguanylate cyclase
VASVSAVALTGLVAALLAALGAVTVLALSLRRHRRDVAVLTERLAVARTTVEAPATDPVTGLLSGAAFTAAVQSAVRDREPVALLHLGLDGFRGVNTHHGRAAGDAVLAEVARRLRTATRGADDLGRLGGDEFAVLLRDPDAAVDVAVRLLAVLAEPHELGTQTVRVGAAIGVAHHRAGSDLLPAAQSAVSDAKQAGGGCVRVWDESADRQRGIDAETVEALRTAVAGTCPDNHLEVHYQPTVDVESRVVSGVECLVRWRRGDRLVPPDEFIGLAERHGLIADLGLAVLERAVADAPCLHAAAGRDLVIAVNVSAPQLADPRLSPAVAAAVRDLGAETLVLEMTESVLVAEDPVTQQTLDALVAAGAHLTVDDFGTGYATLAYLRRRPFSAFKIDRSYVRDIEHDPRTRALVEGLVLLAATMGLGLVAEGVETPEQAELLRAMGAPTHQGFLHARPAPLGRTVETITELRERFALAVPRSSTLP